MKERRLSIRLDKAFPVYLAGEEGVTRGIARNITGGGIFIETCEPYRLGARVKITFVGPDNEEITLVGEVRYQCFLSYGVGIQGESQLRGMGIRFVEAAPEEIGEIAVATSVCSDSVHSSRMLH